MLTGCVCHVDGMCPVMLTGGGGGGGYVCHVDGMCLSC